MALLRLEILPAKPLVSGSNPLAATGYKPPRFARPATFGDSPQSTAGVRGRNLNITQNSLSGEERYLVLFSAQATPADHRRTNATSTDQIKANSTQNIIAP